MKKMLLLALSLVALSTVSAFAVSCPSGLTYNSVHNACEASPSCPDGWYLGGTGTCYELPDEWAEMSSCPNGSYYAKIYYSGVRWTGCYAAPQQNGPVCPSGTTYNPSLNICVAPATTVCPPSTNYNAGTNLCVVNPTCGAGYAYNTYTHLCQGGSGSTPPICVTGTTFNPTTNQCQALAYKLCPASTVYNAARNECEASPQY